MAKARGAWAVLLAAGVLAGTPAAVRADDLAGGRGSGQLADNIRMAPEILSLIPETSGMVAPYDAEEAKDDDTDTAIRYGVKVPDERVPVRDTTRFPASAVVQIFIGTGKGRCSGAMIAPDTVLTAAHCLHEGTKDGDWFERLYIVPGRNRLVSPFGHCKMTRGHVLDAWVTLDTPQEIRLFDLGAIKLDCNVGDKTGWFAIAKDDATVADEYATVVHGYSSNKAPFGTQWLSTDHVRALNPMKVFYQNDTYKGTSGAPVYSDGATPEVFCVHTNGFNARQPAPWDENNACTRLTPQMRDIVATWVADADDAATCAASASCRDVPEGEYPEAKE